MNAPVCVVIPRVAPRRAWLDKARPVVDLCLPYDPANYGSLVYWDTQGGHCEGSLDYYRETKAPRSPAERAAAAKCVALYRQLHGDVCAVVERQRMPHDWRDHAWAGA